MAAAVPPAMRFPVLPGAARVVFSKQRDRFGDLVVLGAARVHHQAKGPCGVFAQEVIDGVADRLAVLGEVLSAFTQARK